MRRLRLAAGAVVLAGMAPLSAQTPATPRDNLDCAIWALTMGSLAEDSAAAEPYGYATSWFLGLYQGSTGTDFVADMLARDAQLSDADVKALDPQCRQRMGEFGSRLIDLGTQMEAEGD